MTDDLELRLRSALVARAGQITQERLRFGVPPTVAAPRKRLRLWRWLPLPAGVAIAAVALAVTLGPGAPDPAPVQPADPGITAPPSPSTPAEPSVKTPVPAPSTSVLPTAQLTPSRSGQPKSVTAAPDETPGVETAAPPEATPAAGPSR